MKPKVLIADDDKQLCLLLAEYLGQQGFHVEAVHSAEDLQRYLEETNTAPVLLILDVMLPGKDGLAALRELRANSSLPVIMLSARGEPMDRVLGIELGADDYLAKPCLPRELLARINALIRRGPARVAGRLNAANITIDLASRSARVGDRLLDLTAAELGLLTCLARSFGRPVSKSVLSMAGLGRAAEPSDRSIDVHVSRLRQKLAKGSAKAPVIEAVRGVGYALIEPSR